MHFFTLALLIAATVASPLMHKSTWDYNSNKVRGVDLGGWLVLEPFITPSMFTSATVGNYTPSDEYTLAKTLGHDEAQRRMKTHWDTFITEKDFQEIKGLGLNFVRIPIGYWAFQLMDGDPYIPGAAAYLERALNWAIKYGLNVWIDLHGAPGSQNGFDNSGRRGDINWQSSQENIDVTLAVLRAIAKRYAHYSCVAGIELLNEPMGPSLDDARLREFFEEGFREVRRIAPDTPIIIEESFLGGNYWNNLLTSPGDNVVIDSHHYDAMSQFDVDKTLQEHLDTACEWGRVDSNQTHWNVEGEWSGALSHCGIWYPGEENSVEEDCTGLSTPTASFWHNSTNYERYRRWVEAQMDSFERKNMAGWMFWTWKTETTVEWSFQKLAEFGIIPQPLWSRRYPSPCH